MNLPLVSGFTFCSCFQRAWYISLPLSLIDLADIMGRVLHFGDSLESSGGKKTPRCSEHTPAQLNQKLLILWTAGFLQAPLMIPTCSQFENNQSRVQVWGYPREKAIDNLKKAKMWNDFEQHVACHKRMNVTLLHGAFLCKWPRFGDTGLQLPLHL